MPMWDQDRRIIAPPTCALLNNSEVLLRRWTVDVPTALMPPPHTCALLLVMFVLPSMRTAASTAAMAPPQSPAVFPDKEVRLDVSKKAQATYTAPPILPAVLLTKVQPPPSDAVAEFDRYKPPPRFVAPFPSMRASPCRVKSLNESRKMPPP